MLPMIYLVLYRFDLRLHHQADFWATLLTKASLLSVSPMTTSRLTIASALRRGNLPGPTGFCGGCDRNTPLRTTKGKRGWVRILGRPSRQTRMRSTLWRSDKTCTRATWSTASVIINLWSGSLHLRWEPPTHTLHPPDVKSPLLVFSSLSTRGHR